MGALTAHERLAAAAYAQGKATLALLDTALRSPILDERKTAKIALALRHPIYIRSFGFA